MITMTSISEEYEYEVWFLNSKEPKCYDHYEKDLAEYDASIMAEKWSPVYLRVIKVTRNLSDVIKYS